MPSEKEIEANAQLIVESVNNAARIKKLLEKSNELRRKSDAKVYELAEKLRIRTEKEKSLDSEKDMNAQLTLENNVLANNAARYKEALEASLRLVERIMVKGISSGDLLKYKKIARNALNIKED